MRRFRAGKIGAQEFAVYLFLSELHVVLKQQFLPVLLVRELARGTKRRINSAV